MSRPLPLIAFCLLAAFFCSAGCVSKPSPVSEKDKTELQQYVLDEAPADIEKLGINYDDKITLLGYKLTPAGTLKGKTEITLTLYWHVEKELGEKGWNLFTHLLDGADKRIANADNIGPLRKWQGTQQLLPPSDWKLGKVYVDVQTFRPPAKNKTDELVITTGIWKDKARMPIKAGPSISGDRGLVARLKVKASKGGAEKKHLAKTPELRADRLDPSVKIKIDGTLDEDAWKTAPSTGPFVGVATGEADKASSVQGSARVLWSAKDLYLAFEVEDANIVGGFDKASKDPHLWTKDTIEVMIDPDGDGDNRDYYEIQVNPQNLVFDSQFDQYNKPKQEPDGPFGHQEWSANLQSAVVIDGTLDKDGDKDKGYTVEIRIPWASFGKAKKSPPELGNQWRMNFYAMETNSGVSWSPILGQGNFHRASRFGTLLWAEQGWQAPVPAPTLAAPAASGAPSGEDETNVMMRKDPSKGAPTKRAMPAIPPGALQLPKIMGKSPSH